MRYEAALIMVFVVPLKMHLGLFVRKKTHRKIFGRISTCDIFSWGKPQLKTWICLVFSCPNVAGNLLNPNALGSDLFGKEECELKKFWNGFTWSSGGNAKIEENAG